MPRTSRKLNAQDDKYSLRTHLLIIQFVTLMYVCRTADSKGISTQYTIGTMRNDYAKVWELLENDIRAVETLQEQEQYMLVILGNWLSQRYADCSVPAWDLPNRQMCCSHVLLPSSSFSGGVPACNLARPSPFCSTRP